MSKVEEKGRANLKYSRFDQYDTAVLETILQADFDAPEAEQMEVEQALYIASLLAERKGIAHKDVAVAKQEFDKYYYPLAKQGDVLYNIDKTPETHSDFGNNALPLHTKIWRRFASVAAVLLIFVFGGTLTAYAFGYDPFAAIARWNDEHFWFEKQLNVSEVSDILSDYGDIENLIPKWLPDGYEFEGIDVVPYPDGHLICSSFIKHTNDGERYISVDYRQGMKTVETYYEKTEETADCYEKGGIKHYMIKNSANLTVVWLNNGFECSIAGDISVSEAERIIDSLYGG